MRIPPTAVNTNEQEFGFCCFLKTESLQLYVKGQFGCSNDVMAGDTRTTVDAVEQTRGRKSIIPFYSLSFLFTFCSVDQLELKC